MQIWDTTHGTRLLLEILLGEGYEADLREFAYAIDEVAYFQDNSRGNVESESVVERNLIHAQNNMASRLAQAMMHLLDAQVATMVTTAKSLVLGD